MSATALDRKPNKRGQSLLTVARVVAVVAFALLVPLAGLLVLVVLVFMRAVRIKADIPLVLVMYVVLLMLVPSRYSISSFSVTAAAVMGFVALVLSCYGKMLPDADVSRGVEGVLIAAMFLVGVMLFSYGSGNVFFPETIASANRNFVVLVGLFGVILALCTGVRTMRHVQLILGTLVVCGGIIGVIGVAQYALHLDISSFVKPPGFSATSHEAFIYSRAGLSRVAGTARHPIEFGIVCAALLPLALHFGYWGRTQVMREIGYGSAAFLALSIALSLSRSAIFGVAVSAIVLLPTWIPSRRFKALVAMALLIPILGVVAPGITTTIGELFTGDAGAGSLDKRADATDYALDRWAEAPWFGHGFGTSVESEIIIDNQWLNTAIETGLLGLVAVGGLLATGVWSARHARKLFRDQADRDLAQTLLAMILSLAVGGLGLNFLRFPMAAGVIFLIVGMTGPLLRLAREEDARAQVLPPDALDPI